MVGTSTAIMFGLMYLNTYALEHVYFSETRFYMTFVMGAVMAVVMLAFMWGMYTRKAMNAAILVGSAALFAGALWLVRSQVTVQDESWMRAMIPHHSIAIMTSERADTTDPRVSALAEEIVVAQDREIAEMRFLLADIAANGEAGADWPLGKTEGPAVSDACHRSWARTTATSAGSAARSDKSWPSPEKPRHTAALSTTVRATGPPSSRHALAPLVGSR